MKHNTQKGITLVALVITIIILLILAGITINLTLGENGLLNRAESAKEKHEEEAAREKLELALGEIYSHKTTDSNYNENEFIDNKINSQDMILLPNTNIVIVDNWLFEIDRSVPKIINSLGKGNENKNIKITINQPIISSDYVTATIPAQITFDGEISSITIKGKNIEIPTPENGTYNIQDIVRDNGTYTILVKDKEGNYKFETIKITELTEDMEIWNKADMETFRDKVNSGRTFEGRTARVLADIDLQGSQSNQWIPIANVALNANLVFKGTFEGNNHTISNVYINNSSFGQGLFSDIVNANISGIILNNSTISATYNVGGITAYSTNSNILNCHINNNVTIKATGENQNGSYVGGIAGNVHRRLTNKYNKL